MTIITGDAGGLAFYANDHTDFYRFTLHSNGLFELFVSQRSEPLAQGHVNIYWQQSNLLTVIVRNNDIALYVNKQRVAEVNDSTFSLGSIGVFGYDTVNTTDVKFQNAQVWVL